MKNYYRILRFAFNGDNPLYFTARGTFSDKEIDSFLFTNYADIWATVNLLTEVSRKYSPGYYSYEIQTVVLQEEEE